MNMRFHGSLTCGKCGLNQKNLQDKWDNYDALGIYSWGSWDFMGIHQLLGGSSGSCNRGLSSGTTPQPGRDDIVGKSYPMTDPWCCYILCSMDPINIPQSYQYILAYIPAPWIRHGYEICDQLFRRRPQFQSRAAENYRSNLDGFSSFFWRSPFHRQFE